jgi:hypothetical protein
MCSPSLFAEVEGEFWGEGTGEYRSVVNEAFVPFIEWRNACRQPQPSTMLDGLLPGDFSASLEVAGDRRVGVVGLNTAFLQLTGGDYLNKLSWSPQQFHAACGGDGPDWVAEHDVCLLLTHHGPMWLNDDCRNQVYPEINPAGRFAVHLFGHMHENVIGSTSIGGGQILRQWQGNSLFSREPWGDPPKIERRHGYAVGCIEFDDRKATIRHWPRKSVDGVNGIRLIPDHAGCVLCADEGTASEELPLRKRKFVATRFTSDNGLSRRQAHLIAAYRQAALALIDIVDLANLPEDDRHIAMQRFMLRQLYIPLRLTLDQPKADGQDEETLVEWELRRERIRLSSAGRTQEDVDIADTEVTSHSLGDLLAGRRNDPKELTEPGLEPKTGLANRVSRLVILGDPGGGKTTLLRWLATAWLLRTERPSDAAELPDVGSLPEGALLPILVRCRQLDREALGECTLADILLQALRPMELKLPDGDLAALIEALVQQLDCGGAALLIDGLDEITDPQLRSRFCGQLNTIATQYVLAPLIVTSRIVGYREMPRRLGQGFRHATLADLTAEAKDDFVRRWCEAVERDPTRRHDEQAKLLAGIHDASRRIERLTGNPMLLTTMALVQRKVGRLPARRHKLYEEAVGVLLNWRGDVDAPLDADEAWPQLEYLAWAMCDRGEQQLRRDQVLDLLDAVRREYPHIRPLMQHTPEEFLRLVESRTRLLVEVGAQQHNGRQTPVYEFRHLSIQEYLAAVALIRGHFPGHDPAKSLADRIRPLAGKMEKARRPYNLGDEYQVSENWREVLRLCIAACNDDDVDSALRTVLGEAFTGAESNASPELPPAEQARPRAILAALCLADEPNASQSAADQVFRSFAAVVGERDGLSRASTGLDHAALEVAASVWSESLEFTLTAEFLRRDSARRGGVGGLPGMISVQRAFGQRSAPQAGGADEHQLDAAWTQLQIDRMRDVDDIVAVAGALAMLEALFNQNTRFTDGLAPALLDLTSRGAAAAHAACWTIYWLIERDGWKSEDSELGPLLRLMPGGSMTATDPEVLRWLANLARQIRSPHFTPGLLVMISNESENVRHAAIKALGQISDPYTVEPLLSLLTHESEGTRNAAIEALGNIGAPGAFEPIVGLLSNESAGTRESVINALGGFPDTRAVDALIGLLSHESARTRDSAIAALGRNTDQRATEALLKLLSHQSSEIRVAAMGSLARNRDESEDLVLLSRDVDGISPWLDPVTPIDRARIERAASELGMAVSEVRERYIALATTFGLRLEDGA